MPIAEFPFYEELVGQKVLLRPQGDLGDPDSSSISRRVRELALFNLAVDSKLRSCDLVKLQVKDITRGDRMAARAIVVQ